MKKAARRGRNLAAKIVSPEGDGLILAGSQTMASIFSGKFPCRKRINLLAGPCLSWPRFLVGYAEYVDGARRRPAAVLGSGPNRMI